MMKVRYVGSLTSVEVPGHPPISPGDEIEVDDDAAAQMVDGGEWDLVTEED